MSQRKSVDALSAVCAALSLSVSSAFAQAPAEGRVQAPPSAQTPVAQAPTPKLPPGDANLHGPGEQTAEQDAGSAASEIAVAADVGAEVATLSAHDEPADPLSAPDLREMGLGAAEVADHSLQIYGFASTSYTNFVSPDRQVINQFVAKEGSFFVGDLNLYLAKQLSDQWRSMIELRVTYAPNGRVLTDGTIENNQSYDMANIGRPVSWGGVNIERAYIEYSPLAAMTVRAGSYLTPYGIWNVDHGAPVIISMFRPYVMNEQIFPERQTGLQVYGSYAMGRYTFGYDLTASNGRGSFDQFRDLDETKAFGGRLQLETPWLGGLRFGASVYHGRYVDRESDYKAPNPVTMDIDNVTPRGTRYDELAYAFDLLYEWNGLRVQAEFVGHDFEYLEGARAVDGPGFRPNSYSLGGYVLAGYRFEHLWNVMPFAFYQRYQKEESSQTAVFGSLENYAVGLNFRPIPTLILKAQFGQYWIPDGNAPVDDELLSAVSAQVSWVF